MVALSEGAAGGSEEKALCLPWLLDRKFFELTEGLHQLLQVLGDPPHGQHQGEQVLLLWGVALYN